MLGSREDCPRRWLDPAPAPHPPSVVGPSSRSGRAEGGQQFRCCPADELFLAVPTDLYQREVGEAGGLEFAYSSDVSLDVGTAGHLCRHVFLAHRLASGVERRGNGEL